MQDKAKIETIYNLIREIESANIAYGDEKQGFYFDYDTVIELLQKASYTAVSTVKCPKPKDIPADMPWCESMNNEDFNPYVYRGDMSPEDFEKAQKLYFGDNEISGESIAKKSCSNCFYFNDTKSDEQGSPCSLCYEYSNWEDWEGQTCD